MSNNTQPTNDYKNNLNEYYSRYGGFWVYPELLDFCYLVNPYFKKSKIIDEMEANFRTLVSEYPAGMTVNSALASECWSINSEYIVPGNGAAELIKILIENLEGKLGIIRPTFEEYPNRFDKNRLEVFIPSNEDFRYDENDLIDYFGRHPVDTILLINPDNPSGNFVSKSGLLRLADWCLAKGVKLILDESFVDFSVGFEHNSCLSNKILERYHNLTVIKSISKSYGVPGLRLGILCSSDTDLIHSMKKKVSIWNINSFAEFFMQIYPKYRQDYISACNHFIETRDEFEHNLKKIPFIRVMPSQANYFFIEVLPPYSPTELCGRLLKEHNILASACLAKKGITPDRYMRIAVRNKADNNRLTQALMSFFNHKHI